MVQISAVIIAFNEEKNIGRCLASLKGVADDVVVVDSFSTDRTEEICKTYGARFVQHAFAGHIEQKNWAITQAQFPCVLSLDADEALDETLKASVIAAKQKWDCDGYYMNRLTNYCGQWIRHCGWYPDSKLRLWDSRKGRWTGINPHDKYELNEGDKYSGQLQGDILHYSFYSIDDHLKQVEYFTDISSRALHAEGKKATWLQLFFSPVVKFFRDYFFKLGFLDGYYGFVVCRISARATRLKYSKLRKLSA